MAKKAGTRGTGLRGLSVAMLQAEIRRRERSVGKLVAKYNKALAKAEAIAAQIRAAGGTVRGGAGPALSTGGRKRPKNDSNLVDALVEVLKGKTMGVTEVAEAVQRAGYKTSSANFRTIVNQALIKHTKKFKKVSRGQYTAA